MIFGIYNMQSNLLISSECIEDRTIYFKNLFVYVYLSMYVVPGTIVNAQ